MDLIERRNLNAVEQGMFANHIPIQKNLCLPRNVNAALPPLF